jgi:hypothetical protein
LPIDSLSARSSYGITSCKRPCVTLETPIDSHQSVKDTSRKHKFVPKKSLEEVLSQLRGKVYVIPNPEQDLVYENKIKIKRQGKQKMQRVHDLDFRNKRNGPDFFQE